MSPSLLAPLLASYAAAGDAAAGSGVVTMLLQLAVIAAATAGALALGTRRNKH